MKKYRSTMLIVIISMLIAGRNFSYAQEETTTSLQIGVSYYPERNSEKQWPIDYQKMKDAGIKRIRIAEFAWSTMEPSEGQYNWEWLDNSIKLAEEFGLKVVLCTPTATPPVWLSEKYPETLPINEVGYRSPYGCRQHRCYNSPAYLKYSDIIVEEMAKRYANNSTVISWQLDNEFGGEQKYCYCENCDREFQGFLKNKYQTIDELNKRWINAFWSEDYQRFDQIKTPKRYDASLWIKNHPSIELEFCRFSSHSIVKYANRQINIIKKYSKNQLITTNRSSFAWGDNLNWYPLMENLDISGFDLYSTTPYEIAFYADFNRSLKPGQSWFMEFGVASNTLRDEMELLQNRGVDWLYMFKFKPFPAGQEQSMQSLLTITGERTKNYDIIQKWTTEKPQRKKLSEAEIGLIYDFEASWVYYIKSWGKLTERLKYQDYIINTVYKSIFKEDNQIDILSPFQEFGNLKTIILPRQIIYRPELETRLIEFIKEGGKVVVTNDFFWKNEDNVFISQLPAIYKDVIGVTDNNFIQKDKSSPLILVNKKYGKGKFIMLREDANYEQWKQIVDNTLTE